MGLFGKVVIADNIVAPVSDIVFSDAQSQPDLLRPGRVFWHSPLKYSSIFRVIRYRRLGSLYVWVTHFRTIFDFLTPQPAFLIFGAAGTFHCRPGSETICTFLWAGTGTACWPRTET